MNVSDQHTDIDAYVAGQLAPDLAAEAERHIENCEVCRMEATTLREMQEFLGEVPPEGRLEGYPDDADLVLQRALRQMRTESAAVRRRSRFLAATAAVAAAAALIGGGVLFGRATTGDQPTLAEAPPPQTTNVAPPQPTGVRFASATDDKTGARIVVRLTPAAGWVRVNAAVSGIAPGERCRLILLGTNGQRDIAGSWVVPEKELAEGTTLDGSSLLAPDDVMSVVVENTAGKRFVVAKV
jgi:hypothetical protein